MPNEKFTFSQFVKFVMQLKTIWGEIRSKTKIYVAWREMNIKEQTMFLADDEISSEDFVEQYLTIWPEGNSSNELIQSFRDEFPSAVQDDDYLRGMIGNYIKNSKIFAKGSLTLEDVHTTKRGSGAATAIILSCEKKTYMSGRVLNDIYKNFALKMPIMRLTNLKICIIIKNKGEFYITNNDGYINNDYFYTVTNANSRNNYSKGIYQMKHDHRCTV